MFTLRNLRKHHGWVTIGVLCCGVFALAIYDSYAYQRDCIANAEGVFIRNESWESQVLDGDYIHTSGMRATFSSRGLWASLFTGKNNSVMVVYDTGNKTQSSLADSLVSVLSNIAGEDANDMERTYLVMMVHLSKTKHDRSSNGSRLTGGKFFAMPWAESSILFSVDES